MTKIARLFTAVTLITVIGTFSACKKTFDEPPGPADPQIEANTTIANLKALHTVAGQIDPITDNIIISGIVTANDRSGNLYKEIYIEDSTGAIKILLDATGLYATYPVGRRVWVLAKGLYISDDATNTILGVRSVVAGTPSVRGILSSEITNYIKAGSINNPVIPTVVSFSDLGTGLNNPWIGRLITLENFEVAPGDTSKTWGDTSFYKADQNINLQAACGGTPIIVRSSAYSNFAALNVPTGTGNITALYVPFRTTKQLIIRDTADVDFHQPRCGSLPPGTNILLEETFESFTVTTSPYPVFNKPGWTNLAEVGGRTWDVRMFSANKYGYLSAFGSNQATVTTWLVTPGVDLSATTGETLTFKTMQGFILTTTPGGTPVQSALKVLVSTDYTGTGNPWAAGVNWTDITSQAALSPGSTTSTFPASFTNSGNIDLSGYNGTVYVAFRYEGADPTGTANDKTSAWEIDDIRITGL